MRPTQENVVGMILTGGADDLPVSLKERLMMWCWQCLLESTPSSTERLVYKTYKTRSLIESMRDNRISFVWVCDNVCADLPLYLDPLCVNRVPTTVASHFLKCLSYDIVESGYIYTSVMISNLYSTSFSVSGYTKRISLASSNPYITFLLALS